LVPLTPSLPSRAFSLMRCCVPSDSRSRLIEPSAISRLESERSLMSAAVIDPFLMSPPSISVFAANAEPVVENTSAVIETTMEGEMRFMCV
jgi:hypothetical protein